MLIGNLIRLFMVRKRIFLSEYLESIGFFRTFVGK